MNQQDVFRSLTRSFSRLGTARTDSALHSAYRERFGTIGSRKSRFSGPFTRNRLAVHDFRDQIRQPNNQPFTRSLHLRSDACVMPTSSHSVYWEKHGMACFASLLRQSHRPATRYHLPFAITNITKKSVKHLFPEKIS